MEIMIAVGVGLCFGAAMRYSEVKHLRAQVSELSSKMLARSLGEWNVENGGTPNAKALRIPRTDKVEYLIEQERKHGL